MRTYLLRAACALPALRAVLQRICCACVRAAPCPLLAARARAYYYFARLRSRRCCLHLAAFSSFGCFAFLPPAGGIAAPAPALRDACPYAAALRIYCAFWSFACVRAYRRSLPFCRAALYRWRDGLPLALHARRGASCAFLRCAMRDNAAAAARTTSTAWQNLAAFFIAGRCAQATFACCCFRHTCAQRAGALPDCLVPFSPTPYHDYYYFPSKHYCGAFCGGGLLTVCCCILCCRRSCLCSHFAFNRLIHAHLTLIVVPFDVC